jgi:quinol-cytochrome oxidoreductase complex cytochrome b subunit
MPKATPTELLFLLIIFVVGITASTLWAAYDPDSNGYVYVAIVSVASILVATFFMARKKAT